MYPKTVGATPQTDGNAGPAAYRPDGKPTPWFLHIFSAVFDVIMPGALRLAAVVLAVLWSGSAAAEAARGTLREVSLRIVEVFNSRDGAALQALLSPGERSRRSAEDLTTRLHDCHRRFGPLRRISIPTMGTRTYGLIAGYFAGTVRDIFLEIDPEGGIKVLTIVAADGSCSLAGPESSEALPDAGNTPRRQVAMRYNAGHESRRIPAEAARPGRA